MAAAGRAGEHLASAEDAHTLVPVADPTKDPSFQAEIDAAEGYEALLVPALLGEWPPRVAEEAAIRPGQSVLDLACGTGILAREAAARVGPAGRVAGLDPDPGMLEVARRRSPAIDWRRGVAESLPFPDESFDAVVCQFGLTFFTDRPGALREALRVLVPGGRLAFGVWDSLERNPAYAAEVALLERLAGREAADPLRAPFALGDPDEVGGLFRDSGATSVQIGTHGGRARFPALRVMLEADLRGWLPVMGVHLPEERIARILEEAEVDLAPYVTADGAVEFETSAHIVTGARG